jgi:PRC-barrel domain
MKRRFTILAGLLCAFLVLAQDTTRTTTTSSSTTTTVQYQRVSQVVGTSVSLGTETLGKVTEVVISSDGCIEYLIVQYADGFVPIPWAVTTVNFEQRTFVIQSTDVTVARLRELTFTEGRWPNFADQRFTQQVRTVWGERAIRSGSGTSGTRKDTTDRPGTTDRKDAPTKDRPGTTDRPKDTDRKDRPADQKDTPVRPKDKDSGAERPKLDVPKTDAPRKEPPKKDGDKRDPDRPKDKKDKDGGR